MVLAIISKTAINKNTRLYIIGCKIGCLFYKTLIFNVYCGETGYIAFITYLPEMTLVGNFYVLYVTSP